MQFATENGESSGSGILAKVERAVTRVVRHGHVLPDELEFDLCHRRSRVDIRGPCCRCGIHKAPPFSAMSMMWASDHYPTPVCFNKNDVNP